MLLLTTCACLCLVSEYMRVPIFTHADNDRSSSKTSTRHTFVFPFPGDSASWKIHGRMKPSVKSNLSTLFFYKNSLEKCGGQTNPNCEAMQIFRIPMAIYRGAAGPRTQEEKLTTTRATNDRSDERTRQQPRALVDGFVRASSLGFCCG